MQKVVSLLLCAFVALGSIETLRGQGTAFLYQGQLNDGGSPANGIYDLRFSIFDSTNNPGTLIIGPETNSAVVVANGLFTIQLDFGQGIFTGPDRWLQIAVRTNGVGSFTNLSPRQHLTPVPYAIFANTASNLLGSVAATQLSGTLPSSAFAGYTNTVALTNGANLFNGTFSGSGTNLANLNASQLTGGTVADARLSTNVALLNGTQTFSGANAFTNFGNSFRGSFFGNGLVGWLVPSGANVQAVSDTGYLLTNSQLTTATLPSAPNVDDIVRISGAGTGGWRVAQNDGQSILGSFASFSNSFWTLSDAVSGNWQSIASSAAGNKMVAASNGSGIEVSSDSGMTWATTSADSIKNWRWVASSSDGNKLVAIVFGGGIYTNLGTTWTATSATSQFWDSVASSSDGSKLVASVADGGIWTSANSGSTWAQQTVGLPTNPLWFSVASSSDGNYLVAAVQSGGIYTSANAGASWGTGDAPGSAAWNCVASSADGSKLAAVVYGGGIYTSVNSGAHWVQQTGAPTANWEGIASSADGNRLAAAANGGGIYLSSNGGATWIQNSPTNGAFWDAIASSADGGRLAATVHSGGIYISQAALQSATTTGTNGYISGSQGSAVELQYIGGGEFMPVSSAGTIWAH